MKWVGSPNFTEGRGGKKPDIVVIHVMAGSLSGTDAWFNNPSSQVSAHYGIGLDGTVHQYVKEEDTAWANGRVSYPTSKIVKEKGGNPNLYSISIEHEGDDLSKAPQTQLDASRILIKDICLRNSIPFDREHVIGHYEIFSGKPNCPATDKTIIDKLITKEEVMEKSFVEAIETLVGKDYGENLNENEQKDAAGRISDVAKKLSSLGAENSNLTLELGKANTEIDRMKLVVRDYSDNAGICEPELKMCRENLRIMTEKAEDGIKVYGAIETLVIAIQKMFNSSKQ